MYILIKRDPISHKYERNFGKVDALLAYFGGILSIVVASVGVIMTSYNKLEFQVNQLKNLYSFKKNKSFDADSFNFFKGIFYYFVSKLYNVGAIKKFIPKM